MKKLLVVCGPTATGKTELALALAKKFNGELVSADSRQVYKYLDIGTGKDVPPGFKFETSPIALQNKKVGYYTDRKTRIWGYDLALPSEEFSVSQYVDVAKEIIKFIHKRNKLPILVGGTGLYIKGITDGIVTSIVPKDEVLREELSDVSVVGLQKKLKKLDMTRFETMNASDQKNPRRLVRAIEIARFGGELPTVGSPEYEVLFIGLTLNKEELEARTGKRINNRVQNGVREEIDKLLQKGITWRHQAMSSIGYRQWEKYYAREQSAAEAREEWKTQEWKYAKRQKTWFKRNSRINWFDVSKVGYSKKIDRLVKKWYKRVDA